MTEDPDLPVSYPLSVYARRISRAQRLVAERRLGAAIFGTGPELAYLTGSWTSSHERLTALVVPPVGDARLIAPATDAGELNAVASLPGVRLTVWRDGEDPYAAAARAAGPGPVALGSSLTADHVLRLQVALGETVLAGDALADLFTVKEPAEVEQLAFAAEAIDRVHAAVPSLVRAGRTEREIADDLTELILREHASVDFVIVGSGPNGANPHHEFSGRVLQPGDPVVVDIGGSVGAGYHSDCTRTYVVGDAVLLDASFRAAYDLLRSAQAAAVATARPGMTAGELDAVARGPLKRAGFGREFSHRLGHGIGLALHEAPFIVAGDDTILEEGMTFSIEPGIYLPGQWGMRIEDIVVLERAGARPLNSAPRGLVACGP